MQITDKLALYRFHYARLSIKIPFLLLNLDTLIQQIALKSIMLALPVVPVLLSHNLVVQFQTPRQIVL